MEIINLNKNDVCFTKLIHKTYQNILKDVALLLKLIVSKSSMSSLITWGRPPKLGLS